MKSPSTYAEWVACFDLLKTGSNDEEVLDAVFGGRIKLSPGVAGRFGLRINEVMQHRVKKAVDKFQRATQASGSDLNVFVNALIDLRNEYKFLIKFAKMPVLPPNDAEVLVNAIKSHADSVQGSLESMSRKTDRIGVITSAIRQNRVNNLEPV